MQKSGFVYIWRDRKHKRYYIGCRWGHINDSYICSSTWMKAAFNRRPNDFKRRILESNISDRSLLLEREYYWLKQIKKNEIATRYYNLHNHKFNHWSTNPKTRIELSKLASQRNKGKSFSPETQFKPGERRSISTEFKAGTNPHNKNKKLTNEETRYKMSIAKLGKPSFSSTKFKKGQRTGETNINATRITTPFGEYLTIVEAASVLQIPKATLNNRLSSVNYPDWRRI